MVKLILFFYLGITDSIKIDIPTVEITSSRLKANEISKRSVSAIDSNNLNFSRGLGIGDVLMKSTSLFTTSTENFSQDLRISMRGYGMRSAFGIRGIKIVVDGIPESTPDGQGDVDNISSSIISSINILSGPANGIYSNATGGVIEMETYNPQQSLEILSTTSLGAFGLRKQSLFVGGKKNNHTLSLNFDALDFRGYRTHSNHTNFNGHMKIVSNFSSSLINQFILNTFINPVSKDPGGLTLTQVENNPRQARDQNVLFNAGEDMSQIKVSNLIKYRINGYSDIFGSIYFQNRDFKNRLAFVNGGAVAFVRQILGVQFGFKTRSILLTDDLLQIGVDHDDQIDKRKRYNNQNGVNGALSLDQDESFQASGAYLSYSAKLSKWEMLLSTRYELINISLTDNFLVNGDQSGKRNFQPATGSLRLGYNVSNAFYLGAAMLSGFETPTLTEIINNPDGLGFAPIDPAFTKGIELMTEIRNKDVTLKFSVYDYASSNELIPYQLTNQQGRVFYRNGGKSNRKGIEVESKCRSSNWLETVISGNLNKFLLNENSTNIDSKIIAGIPQSAFKIGFIVSPNSSSSIMADMIYNGSIYADQNNEVKIDPQHGLHIHGQHIFKFKKLELIPSLGGRFMISHLNYNNILINAVGNRYYEPMSRVSWYAKIVCSFKK